MVRMGFKNHLLLAVSMFLIFMALHGCKGRSNPALPGLDDFSNAGLSRMFSWTVVDEDEGIADSAAREKNADVTNVVWGHYWHPYNRAGYIKKAGVPQGNSYHGTIVAYQGSVDPGDTDIFFSACYRDSGGVDHSSTPIQVDTALNSEVQIYPAVTAHIDEGYKIVVDIVYLLGGTYTMIPNGQEYVHYRIRHCRYKEQTAMNLDFQLVQAGEINPPDPEKWDHYFHPDIVYDAGTPDDGDFLHVVYTYFEHTTAEERDICYMRGEESANDIINWPGDYEILSDEEGGYCNQRPRIDVGVDSYLADQGYEYYIVENEITTFIPYVGVVWEQYECHKSEQEWGDRWSSTVVFCRLSHNDGKNGFYELEEIDAGFKIHGMPPHVVLNVFPYIDIEPRENITTTDNSACTHICFTQTGEVWNGTSQEWEWDSAYGVEVEVTNTYRIVNYNDGDPPACYVTIVSSNSGASTFNGLATLAIKIDTQGHEEEGYLAWISAGEIADIPVEVYAADLAWSDTTPWGITISNVENISYGASSLGVNSDYGFFPETAIQNETIGKAVWTEKSTADEPDIFGDFSDWEDE